MIAEDKTVVQDKQKKYDKYARSDVLKRKIDEARLEVLDLEYELSFLKSLSDEEKKNLEEFFSIDREIKAKEAIYQFNLKRLIFFKGQREINIAKAMSKKCPKTIHATYNPNENEIEVDADEDTE